MTRFEKRRHLLVCERLPWSRNDASTGPFPVQRGGDADDAALGDRGMLVEDVFDLARTDVLTAPDDEVFGASNHSQVAVGIDPAKIAGSVPAVANKGLVRVGRVVEVPE